MAMMSLAVLLRIRFVLGIQAAGIVKVFIQQLVPQLTAPISTLAANFFKP
jgi:hypothetical protein